MSDVKITDDKEVSNKTPDELLAIGITQINNELSNKLSIT